MSKYDDFEIFISEIISETNAFCIQKYGKDIDSLYHSDCPICNIIKKLLAKGWTSYISIVTLIDLNKPRFNDVMKVLGLSPLYMNVEGMQEGKEDIGAVSLLMLYKKMPVSVKILGDAYKKDFECHINEVSYIDSMAKKLLLNILN